MTQPKTHGPVESRTRKDISKFEDEALFYYIRKDRITIGHIVDGLDPGVTFTRRQSALMTRIENMQALVNELERRFFDVDDEVDSTHG